MKHLRRLLVVALVAGLTAPAVAQAPPRTPPRVIELEAMVIEGKIAKPQVFYVLGRSRISYEGIRLERSFVERIIESARSNPF